MDLTSNTRDGRGDKEGGNEEECNFKVHGGRQVMEAGYQDKDGAINQVFIRAT